ncbi:MAG: molybdenum cofactor biosynthesis protein MoaE [Deltaproteobacteria bacterium]|nr:molybdenum cofactor biosynthesis protein MoaE [Deltaproteobacteria bacterium]
MTPAIEDKPVRIQEGDFSVEEEVDRIKQSSRGIGAVVAFLGVARDSSGGKAIMSVSFEQYASMALKALEALREDALRRFDIIDARIVHRVTAINPGGNIVLITVASAHREEAFRACSWCIDTLKKTVPLWKKETTPEGESWVVPHA